MLKVTKKQMAAIEGQQKENFISLMVVFVKTNFPEKNEEPELRSFVSDVITKGEKYHYELETDYEFFLDLHCSFIELNMDPLPPKLLSILKWPDREAHEKNELLFNALKFNYYATKQ
ncbi:MAG: hypothetical protein NTW54_01425 [Bacteroidetes bacterium]|nr:hypothetical protein [Bacteroidota bacterium]